MIDRGRLDRLSPAGYSKLGYSRSWSSQEWKSEVTAHDGSGKLDETSWSEVQQFCLHHEAALLDGNAQSVRYGEIVHDGSGQLDSANYQGVKCQSRLHMCKEVSYWTMVICWSRFRKEVVFYGRE